MATNTTNYSLSKPAYGDTADIAVINSNMDKVDTALHGLGSSIAIVSKGNTHDAVTSGQYVYVHGHGSLSEGLYTAKSNISANATLSTSNLQAVSDGGLNKLNEKIDLANNSGSDPFRPTTLANISSALDGLLSDMAAYEVKALRVIPDEAFDVFISGRAYYGYIFKSGGTNYASVQLYAGSGIADAVYGSRGLDGWSFEKAPLINQFIVPKNNGRKVIVSGTSTVWLITTFYGTGSGLLSMHILVCGSTSNVVKTIVSGTYVSWDSDSAGAARITNSNTNYDLNVSAMRLSGPNGLTVT